MAHFIDEHQPVWIKIRLGFKPRLTPDQDVRAVLFARMAGLFLRVMAWRSKNRQIVEVAT